MSRKVGATWAYGLLVPAGVEAETGFCWATVDVDVIDVEVQEGWRLVNVFTHPYNGSSKVEEDGWLFRSGLRKADSLRVPAGWGMFVCCQNMTSKELAYVGQVIVK